MELNLTILMNSLRIIKCKDNLDLQDLQMNDTLEVSDSLIIYYKYSLQAMGKNVTKKKQFRKIKLQNTFMTESDITLSFSQDGLLFNPPPQKIWNEDKHASLAKQQGLSSEDYNSDLLLSAFQQAIRQRLQKPADSQNYHKNEVKQQAQENMIFQQKQMRKFDHIRHKQMSLEDSLDLSDLDLFTSKEEQEQYNAQHSFKGQKQEMLNEQNIRTKMKQIDFTIKRLHLERNRLKYFLRKDKEVIDSDGVQNLSAKQCPCCGKLISKLCFRCQHLYCKVENCPRKKKQVLNARMLEKMREKNPPKNKKKSKGAQLKEQMKDGIQQAPSSEQDISQLLEQDTNENLEISQSLAVIATRSKSKNIIKSKKLLDDIDLSRLLRISESDISIKNSQLFLDSTQQ